MGQKSNKEDALGKIDKWVKYRVAPDTEFAGYPAAGYPANLFCRISGIRRDIWLNS